MGSKQHQTWDFALRLRGIDPASLPMSKLAEYLAELSGLLGESAAPVFQGIVSGSVVLRSSVQADAKDETADRLIKPRDSGAAKYIENLSKLMARDGLTGTLIDSRKKVLLKIDPANSPVRHLTRVHDSSEIDGTVVRVQGKDDSSHIGIVEYGSGRSFSVSTKDEALARELAKHFRAGTLRLFVRGTWIRDETGRWVPDALTVDRFEVLEEQPLDELMNQLQAIPGNGWAELEDPQAVWREIRGIEL